MELTLAEELLLLALHDEKGTTGFTQIDPGLAGALLVDLGRLDALRPEGKELAAVADSGPEHPALARAHAVISTEERLPMPAREPNLSTPGIMASHGLEPTVGKLRRVQPAHTGFADQPRNGHQHPRPGLS